MAVILLIYMRIIIYKSQPICGCSFRYIFSVSGGGSANFADFWESMIYICSCLFFSFYKMFSKIINCLMFFNRKLSNFEYHIDCLQDKCFQDKTWNSYCRKALLTKTLTVYWLKLFAFNNNHMYIRNGK